MANMSAIPFAILRLLTEFISLTLHEFDSELKISLKSSFLEPIIKSVTSFRHHVVQLVPNSIPLPAKRVLVGNSSKMQLPLASVLFCEQTCLSLKLKSNGTRHPPHGSMFLSHLLSREWSILKMISFE